MWTFIALYVLLLGPVLASNCVPVLGLVVATLLVIPIAARNFPYFIIDPIKQGLWLRGYQPGCASGLALPRDYCAHLQRRAETLRDLSARGSVLWSTALPVLTSQMTGLASSFLWTADLFAISRTRAEFNDLAQKAALRKFDFILFDRSEDPFIKPRPPEVSFNRKLLEAIQNGYCAPAKIGGWLVVRRSEACAKQ